MVILSWRKLFVVCHVVKANCYSLCHSKRFLLFHHDKSFFFFFLLFFFFFFVGDGVTVKFIGEGCCLSIGENMLQQTQGNVIQLNFSVDSWYSLLSFKVSNTRPVPLPF